MAPALIAGCGLALVGLLLAELRDAQWARWLCKPLASACFCGLAVALGAPGSGYGRLVLAGQLLGLLGDVLLIGRGTAPFLAGLGVFFGGHVAFCIALAGARGPHAAPALAAAAAGALAAGAGLHRWLLPHVPAALRWPVRAYLVVISAMLVAAAAARPGLQPAALVGALLFYLSDVCVARERFVRPAPANALVGLPLYYAAQVLLACTVRAELWGAATPAASG